MLVLAIDTSSPAVSAALVRVADGVTLASGRAPEAPRGHDELLVPAIGQCLAEIGAQPRDVDAVVAGAGPGPYTGLRVGLVTAAAFADVLGIPAYGVCSLDAVIAQHDGDAVVLTDARRREVYWARYDGRGRRVDGPHVARPADVPLEGAAAIAGAAVELYPDAWPAHLDRLPYRYPDPLRLTELAADRLRGGAPSEVLSPLYLRRPDAVVPGTPKRASQ